MYFLCKNEPPNLSIVQASQAVKEGEKQWTTLPYKILVCCICYGKHEPPKVSAQTLKPFHSKYAHNQIRTFGDSTSVIEGLPLHLIFCMPFV